MISVVFSVLRRCSVEPSPGRKRSAPPDRQLSAFMSESSLTGSGESMQMSRFPGRPGFSEDGV